MNDELENEVERNLFAFLPQIQTLLPEHEGSFALLRDQDIAGIHALLSDALRSAYSRFPDGLFSIQKITEKPAELGMFSDANDKG